MVVVVMCDMCTVSVLRRHVVMFRAMDRVFDESDDVSAQFTHHTVVCVSECPFDDIVTTGPLWM